MANIPDHNTTEDNMGNGNGNGTGDAVQDNGDVPQKKKRGRYSITIQKLLAILKNSFSIPIKSFS